MKVGLGASTLVLAAFAMGGVAFGADAPVPKAPVYTKAPPAPACAPYWAAFGGWNSVSSISLSELPPTPLDDAARRTIDFNDGYVVGGAVGRCVPGWNWLRVEGELSYRRNGVDRITVAGEGSASRNGHISALAVMANAWADFAMTPNVTVHAGGGIGAARVRLGVNTLGGPEAVTIVPLKDSDTVFAFQVGAGAAWHVMPNISVTLDYRYFQAVDPSFSINFGGSSTRFKDDYQSHSIMVGVRGKFATGGP